MIAMQGEPAGFEASEKSERISTTLPPNYTSGENEKGDNNEEGRSQCYRAGI